MHLEQLSRGVGDDVEVHLGGEVLFVVEVEAQLAGDDSDADRSHGCAQRLLAAHAPERDADRHVASGDRRRAGAAVGLDDVAIDQHLPLAERGQIAGGAQRSSDEALDLLRSPALLSLRRLAIGPRVRRARQHAVLGRHPAAAAALHVARNALLGGRGAEHPRSPERAEDASLSVIGEAGDQLDAPKLIGPPPLSRHPTFATAPSPPPQPAT